MSVTATAKEHIRSRIFQLVHRRNLIYNTCWEDPALDRIALQFQPDDRVLVITSAGCNALDYLLAGVAEVHAVDVNPIQNALLELKVAAVKHLDFAAFFELFGQGQSPQAATMYGDALRPVLSRAARIYWDRHIGFFKGPGWRGSFYYRGTSGTLARLVLFHAQNWQRLRAPIADLLAAPSVERQREIYESRIQSVLWTPSLHWFLRRSTTMSLLGVPGPQRQQILAQYPGGIVRFIRDALEAVVGQLPFHDNYFWRVYLQGYYTPDCCPEYLKRENFERLRARLDRLHIHTSTVTNFLRGTAPGISKFVLLDHMDWLSARQPRALSEEWEAILAAARPNARVIFRSAGLQATFLEQLRVQHNGRTEELGSLLRYHPKQAAELHARDRVHTYGSFYIADLPSTAN